MKFSIGCFSGLLVIAILATPAAGQIINFEDLGVAPGTQFSPSDNAIITSNGFDFINGPLSSSPDLHFPNGSQNAIGSTTELLAHDDVIMTRNGGGAFTLAQFDWGSSFQELPSFTVDGELFGGGMVTQTFFPDENEITFETFSLNPSFTNLISVTWEHVGGIGGLQNIDNIFVPELTVLDLDIKPGPSNNTVALNGNGTLQMAIMANADFNVAEVDIDSLLFGDPILVDGGATPLGATSDKLRDVNHDGLDDLLVGFSISDLVAGGALDASSVEGRLTGKLLGGMNIIGSDIVRMVPQNNGGGGSLAIATVPEPGSCVLALAALCLAIIRRRM